jgi:hypothetical protein
MATVFKIKDHASPGWTVEFPDGTQKEYDPWDLQQKVYDGRATARTVAEGYDAIRKAFGLPTESEAVESATYPKPFTFTKDQCVQATTALAEYIEGLPVTKKASSLSRN